MDTVLEENQDEFEEIDEFFTWDEDEEEEGELYVSEETPRQEISDDYGGDIRFNLTQLLSRIQTQESRYIVNRRMLGLLLLLNVYHQFSTIIYRPAVQQ